MGRALKRERSCLALVGADFQEESGLHRAGWFSIWQRLTVGYMSFVQDWNVNFKCSLHRTEPACLLAATRRAEDSSGYTNVPKVNLLHEPYRNPSRNLVSTDEGLTRGWKDVATSPATTQNHLTIDARHVDEENQQPPM